LQPPAADRHGADAAAKAAICGRQPDCPQHVDHRHPAQRAGGVETIGYVGRGLFALEPKQAEVTGALGPKPHKGIGPLGEPGAVADEHKGCRVQLPPLLANQTLCQNPLRHM
jgi:hypothetical protein